MQSKFRPDGTILSVAGNIQWSELHNWSGSLYFGRLAVRRGDFETVEQAPAESEGTFIFITLPPDPHRRRYANVPYPHPDYFQARGAVGVLSDGMSSRLFTEVREKRGLCYTVYASYHTSGIAGGVFCYAGTTPSGRRRRWM